MWMSVQMDADRSVILQNNAWKDMIYGQYKLEQRNIHLLLASIILFEGVMFEEEKWRWSWKLQAAADAGLVISAGLGLSQQSHYIVQSKESYSHTGGTFIKAGLREKKKEYRIVYGILFMANLIQSLVIDCWLDNCDE